MVISNQTCFDLVLCLKHMGRVFQRCPGNFELCKNASTQPLTELANLKLENVVEALFQMLPTISCEQRLVTEFLGNILSNFQLLSKQYAVNTDAVSQRCSLKRVFLKIFAKLTGKHLSYSLCFNKVTVLRPTSLSKKRLLHKCFQEHLKWLLLLI